MSGCSRQNVALAAFTLAVLLTVACAPETDCRLPCNKALDCLLEAAGQDGHDVSGVENERDRLVSGCTAACSHRWSRPNVYGECLATATCSEIEGGACGVEAPDGGPPTAHLDYLLPGDEPLRLTPDSECLAMVTGSDEPCRGLTGDSRDDCFLAVTVKRALETREAARCSRLPPPGGAFCEAVVTRGDCRGLPPPFGAACNRFLEGRAEGDISRLLLAPARGDEIICRKIDDPTDLRTCIALVRNDTRFCRQTLSVDPSAFVAFGKGLRVEKPTGQGPVAAPALLPLVLPVLDYLAPLFWVLALLWAASVLWKSRGLDPRLLAILGMTLAVSLILRLVLARTGPVNFVEYERVFLPAPDDLARLAYSGQAYIASPFFALFGSSFDVVFGLNAVFLPLLCIGVWSLAMKVSGDSRSSLAAVLLVGLNPVVLRMSASASETFGFSVLAIIFIDLFIESFRNWRWGWALALVTPIALIYRPEGLLLAAPALTIAVLIYFIGQRPRLNAALLTPLVIVAAEFGLFAYLFSGLSVPRITWALLAGNGADFLLEMVDPRYHSPLLTLCALAPLALFFPGVRRLLPADRPPSGLVVAAPVFGALLVTAWCIQGTEGNAAFGSARYLVMAEPWLAVCCALVMVLLLRRRQKWAGAVFALLTLCTILQFGLITKETNMQKEFDFMVEAADRIPENALVVLPSADEKDQEFAPENGMLAVLSMSGRDVSWKRLEEVAEGAGPEVFYLFKGFYAPDVQLDALAARCKFTPVLERRVESVPDVAWYADIPEAEEVTLGLYRVACGAGASPLQ